MKIVFFGNTKYSVIGAETIQKAFPISTVVTIPDRELGRKKILTSSPTKSWANSLIINVLKTDHISKEDIETIKNLRPDFLVVEDYGLILPQELLDLPKFAPLNIHHSLLPKYRGPSPAPTAILNADKTSGVTIIKMTSEVDAGNILMQEEYRLTPDETTDSLLKKLNNLGGTLAVKVIQQYLENKEKLTPQDKSKATYTTRIKKSDGFFEIDNPPQKEALNRLIRAYSPWPNVWTIWKGKTVKFYPQGKIQMEGKKPILIEDFLRGYTDFPLKDLLQS